MKKNRLSIFRLREITVSLFMTFFAVLSAAANATDISQKVTLDFNDTEISEVSHSLREQTGHRIITPAPHDNGQSPTQIAISGRVEDSESRPLAGVSVMIKGTREGVSTDAQGRFVLRTYIHDGIILIFSSIGKKDVEISYTGQNDITVMMQDAVNALDQVVVTGYQTIAREKVTGATATVTSDDLSARYSTNILDNLEGKVAGLVNYNGNLTIRGTSTLKAESRPLLVIDGLPTEGNLEDVNPYDIESVTVLKDAAAAAIYGARASNGIIVITTKRATERDKTDVEVSVNMTVYQKRNLDYADNLYLNPAQQVDLESDYFQWYYNESPAAVGNIANTTNAISGLTYLNPITPIQYAYCQLAMNAIDQNEVDRRLAQYRTQNFAKDYARKALRNRTLQQYNVALRNRTDKLQSNLVLNFKRDNAGIINTYDNQLNLFYKASYEMTPWLTVNLSVNSILQRSKVCNNQSALNPFNVPAYYNMYGEDGGYASHIPWDANIIYYNDYATFAEDDPGLRSMRFNHIEELNRDHTITDRQNLRYHTDLLFKVMDGLTFNTQFIYETNRTNSSSNSEDDSFVMRWMRNLYTVKEGDVYRYLIPENGGRLVTVNTRNDSWTGRAQVNFNRVFGTDHSVNFLAGLEFRESISKGTSNLFLGWNDQQQTHATSLVSYPELEAYTASQYFIMGFPHMVNYIYYPNIRDKMAPYPEVMHRNASGYANLTYTYKSRYNAFMSLRKDYADVYGLATEFRGSPFWSVGASWNMDRENFMSDFQWVNMLKIRMSYGITGNIYQDATSYMTAVSQGINRYTGRPWASIESPGNSALSWERSRTLNMGIDFSMFDFRLRGTLDWYNKISDKVFSTKSLESTKGFTSLVMNMADVKNNGVELTLSYDWYRPANDRGFSWTTTATATWNKNRITRVEIQAKTASELIDIGYKEGYPVSSLFSYVFGGLENREGEEAERLAGTQTWITDDGRRVYVGILNESPESLVYSGQAEPKYSYAMENHLAWNGFSLNLMMVWYGGHKMRAYQVHPISGLSPTALPGYLADAWTPDNTDTVVPGVGRHNNTTEFAPSVQDNTDIFVRSADFIKIRNIVLGYDVPHDIARRFGMNNLSLRFQIDNPKALWVKNNIGIDPETGGIARETSYILGLNFRF